MALMNRHLSPKLETVFMVPSLDTTYISASLVREIARYGGDVSSLVHPAVAAALKKRARRRNELSRRRCTRARPRPRGASSFPNRPTSGRVPRWPSWRGAESCARSSCSIRRRPRRTPRFAHWASRCSTRCTQPLPETCAQRVSQPARGARDHKRGRASHSPHAAALRRRDRRAWTARTAASPARCTPPATCCAPRSGSWVRRPACAPSRARSTWW